MDKIWYKDDTKYFKSYKQLPLRYNYIDICKLNTWFRGFFNCYLEFM